MENKKVIILDFDGTLYSGDAAYTKLPQFIARNKRKFFPNLTDYQYRKISTINPEWKNAWTGSDIVEFIYEAKEKYPQYSISIRDYLDWENENIEPILIGINGVKHTDPDFLKNLCKNHPVYIVSNSSINHVKYYMDKMGIKPSWFKKIVSNHFIARDITKKHYFLSILEMENCQPNQAYVFGDSIKSDIVPAKELGMNAFISKEADKLPRIIEIALNL